MRLRQIRLDQGTDATEDADMPQKKNGPIHQATFVAVKLQFWGWKCEKTVSYNTIESSSQESTPLRLWVKKGFR